MMETQLYGFCYTIVYVVLCKMFVESFEQERHFSTDICKSGILFSCIIADYAVSFLCTEEMFIKQILIILFGTLFMWMYFQQKCAKIAILVLLYQGICFAIEYFTIIVLSSCFSDITLERLDDPLVNIILGILSQMLLVCFILLLKRYTAGKSSEMMTAMEWLRFTVFPLFSIVVLVTLLTNFEIPQNSKEKNILVSIAFGLLIMNIIVFYLIHDILKREMQIREDRLFRERVKNETGMYRSISENYDKQRKREHEYKNQLTFIAALARENKVDEISRYLNQYMDELLTHTSLIDANHVIVNAILNAKYQEAKEKGITFVIKVNDLLGLKIKDEDVVLILSNLLSNAMEANEKNKDAIIKVKFVREGSQNIIAVSNTYIKEPVMEGNQFVTTKTEDTDRHGIGIENIREAVDKYGGSCVIKYDEKYFRVSVLIPD